MIMNKYHKAISGLIINTSQQFIIRYVSTRIKELKNIYRFGIPELDALVPTSFKVKALKVKTLSYEDLVSIYVIDDEIL